VRGYESSSMSCSGRRRSCSMRTSMRTSSSLILQARRTKTEVRRWQQRRPIGRDTETVSGRCGLCSRSGSGDGRKYCQYGPVTDPPPSTTSTSAPPSAPGPRPCTHSPFSDHCTPPRRTKVHPIDERTTCSYPDHWIANSGAVVQPGWCSTTAVSVSWLCMCAHCHSHSKRCKRVSVQGRMLVCAMHSVQLHHARLGAWR
jgi:hypothetical protein